MRRAVIGVIALALLATPAVAWYPYHPYGPWWGYGAPHPSWYPYPSWHPYGQPDPSDVTPPPPQRPGYWYACDRPRGYYPYVRGCPGGWRQVPSEPPR